jgi:hypothetical protein
VIEDRIVVKSDRKHTMALILDQKGRVFLRTSDHYNQKVMTIQLSPDDLSRLSSLSLSFMQELENRET